MHKDAGEDRYVMKTGIFAVLCGALVASCFSVRADDNPDQTAALAALKQKMYELDHPEARPLSDTNSPTVVAKPAESITNATNATSVTAASRPTSTKTRPKAAPAAEVPATTAPAEAKPAPTAPANAAFTPIVSVDNTSAQATALVALKQKMDELNHAKAQPPPETNSEAAVAKSVESATNTTGTATTNVVTLPTALVAAPVNEPSAAATPVTETPMAEAPAAKTPATAPVAVAPLSAAPAVVAPAPKAATAPAAAAPSVAVVPAATPGPAVAPATVQPAATLPFPFSSPGLARPTNELVTTAGKIYKNVEVERVVSDGIFISHTPVHGGWAMAKVLFNELPLEIRQQYENK